MRIYVGWLLVALALVARGARAQVPVPAPEDGAEPAAAATALELELSFEAREALPGDEVLLVARLRGADGRGRDAALTVEVDAGVAKGPLRISRGVYTCRITAPTTLDARTSLVVIATAEGTAASAAIPLRPGPARAIAVDVPEDLAADGGRHPLWIAVTDAHGNAVAEEPRLTAGLGSVSEPVPLGGGRWLAEYRAPRSAWAGEDVVRASAGAASASRALPLRAVPAVLTVSPRAGVMLGGGGPALALGADAAAWRAAGPLDLGVVAAIAWWGVREDGIAWAPRAGLDLRADRATLPLTLSLAARTGLGTRGTATLSLGGGAARVSSSTRLAGQPELSESAWAPAATAGLELAFRSRLGAPFAEVRGYWLGAPRLDTVRGAAWPLLLSAGVRFDAY
ncbi:hypothetical protein [Anaeromyxobacter dehalogenans]|uniref:Invasin domain-containing protein n=1 Tax=Anaeromyxobacter dehalogenans (strain 2CP-C) TaxID=290397 RepID=Q2ILS1_ANADE|nr:hypothetical protein [Anaeromyxobacter dehalogenans]ABC82604.1 hypothetical protein Adeh_2834 [Anaeromyxobacter dehalogenans 2CP-C]